MVHNVRAYKGVRPQLGERVMIDATSVVIGNVSLADDVGDLAVGRHTRRR